MQMIVTWTVSFLLAVLPLVMASFFLLLVLPRKLLEVKQDLGKLMGGQSSGNASQGGSASANPIAQVSDVDALAERIFSTATLAVPALLLTVFYLACFVLCDSFLSISYYNKAEPWLFSCAFILAAKPLMFGFGGVYLFNLGTIVRRLYLGDLNDQVFWGAINRLWLSLGLAWIVLRSNIPESSAPITLFAIGFLANIVLDWLLDKALKTLNVGKPKSEDLPLQMVKGINLWKEYRLEEEGIENVQNLATADVLELTVRTHYNFRTLIDWIDQAILLSRLSSDQAKTLASQSTAISAIEFAAASPVNTGSDAVATALAAKLSIDPVLMANTMNLLFQDEYVQNLWNLWQSGKEGGLPPGGPPKQTATDQGTLHQGPAPQTHSSENHG